MMYRDHTIAVVVPAYNEEMLLGRVIKTMPDYVDHIVAVDDCSRDGLKGNCCCLAYTQRRIHSGFLPMERDSSAAGT